MKKRKPESLEIPVWMWEIELGRNPKNQNLLAGEAGELEPTASWEPWEERILRMKSKKNSQFKKSEG